MQGGPADVIDGRDVCPACGRSLAGSAGEPVGRSVGAGGHSARFWGVAVGLACAVLVYIGLAVLWLTAPCTTTGCEDMEGWGFALFVVGIYGTILGLPVGMGSGVAAWAIARRRRTSARGVTSPGWVDRHPGSFAAIVALCVALPLSLLLSGVAMVVALTIGVTVRLALRPRPSERCVECQESRRSVPVSVLLISTLLVLGAVGTTAVIWHRHSSDERDALNTRIRAHYENKGWTGGARLDCKVAYLDEHLSIEELRILANDTNSTDSHIQGVIAGSTIDC